MLKLARVVLVASFFVFLSSPAKAVYTSPLGFSLAPPLQFPPPGYSVSGIRLSALLATHVNAYGLDLGGLGNITTNVFTGIGIGGIFNITQSEATIILLQAAGVINYNSKAHIYGLQIAGFVNYNYAESRLVGIQVAPWNYSPNTIISGMQVGIFNQAKIVNGLQIGLINSTNALHGLQIGLVNFNPTGIFAMAPILNVGF